MPTLNMRQNLDPKVLPFIQEIPRMKTANQSLSDQVASLEEAVSQLSSEIKNLREGLLPSSSTILTGPSVLSEYKKLL